MPELVIAEGGADVTVRLGSVDRPLPGDGKEGCLSATTEEAYVFWEGVGAFLVREGREIVVDPMPGVQDRVLRLFLLGQPLAALLNQRGLPVLHASTVAVADEAVSFVGGSGWGKSTTAAAMHARGHGLVTDDVTAVRADGDRPVVLPGFPQLKLWPESVTALGDDPEALPLLHPEFDKCARRAAKGFSLAPLPLAGIYVLARGERPEITPLRPQEALVELIRHSFGTEALQEVIASSHFLRYASIVRSVPIRRLSRPESLPALSDLARLVEENLARNAE